MRAACDSQANRVSRSPRRAVVECSAGIVDGKGRARLKNPLDDGSHLVADRQNRLCLQAIRRAAPHDARREAGRCAVLVTNGRIGQAHVAIETRVERGGARPGDSGPVTRAGVRPVSVRVRNGRTARAVAAVRAHRGHAPRAHEIARAAI